MKKSDGIRSLLVVVITGCDASEVDHLKHFLAKRIEKASFQELSGFANVEEFQQGLRSVLSQFLSRISQLIFKLISYIR